MSATLKHGIAAPLATTPRPKLTVGAATLSRTYGRLSLSIRFLLVSLFIMVLGGTAVGFWVGRQIEDGVFHRTAAITALYVDSVVSEQLQPLAAEEWLSDKEVASLDHLLMDTSLGNRIAAFKIWSLDGSILYSPNRELIGRKFPIGEGRENALDGNVSAEWSHLEGDENQYERQYWSKLLEVYAPIREHGTGRIIAVSEFYQLPNELEDEVRTARLRSWAVVAGIMLAMYIIMAGIVRRGSDTIIRQQTTLNQQVSQLSRLLTQNARLHDRVRRAAQRSVTLNERNLRRITADLHDGPGQALALALLQLDSAADPKSSTAASSVREALEEMRSILMGLRLPELSEQPLREVVGRAVRDHRRRSGAEVSLEFGDLPEEAPLAIKVALFRSLQELLSNAVRHGGGTVEVSVWVEEGQLYLTVEDHGPGFDPNAPVGENHLGLAGIRERAELLDGAYAVESTPGKGTIVGLAWPLYSGKTS